MSVKPGELLTTTEAKDFATQGGYRRDDWPKINAYVKKAPILDTVFQLLPRNDARVNFKIYNDSANVLYVKEGINAGLDDFSFSIPAASVYEPLAPVYTGELTAISGTAAGNARITENA